MKLQTEEQIEVDFVKQHTKFREFHGKYEDDEFFIDEDLHIFLPPSNTIRPSNCLQFKLILLSSETKVADKVLGWGVFPVVNSEFMMNTGKYKIPLLAGTVDNGISKYQDIEKRTKSNLDTWLCNLYFEI